MKTEIKKFFAQYFNTWWFPSVMAVMAYVMNWPFAMFATARAFEYKSHAEWPITVEIEVYAMRIISLVLLIPLFVGWPVSWIWLLLKKRWREALWSFLLLPTIAGLFFLFLFLGNLKHTL